jgi:hypothetical protein
MTEQLKIGTGKGLRQYLTDVIGEGVKSALAQKALTEKEKQAATSGGDDDEDGGHDADSLFGSDDDSSDDKKGSSSKTMDDETEKLMQGDIKPKDIIEKLNAIRSGRSFKDSSVSSSMEEYIDSLSKAEKVALMAFLKGISQIVTGEISASDAEEPSDNPSDVKMDKSNEKNVVNKKPNIIRGGPAGDSKKPKGGPAEDTTAPAPITPKRR